MKLRFWGVRGSFAMAGREFLRYGGNTTSIELRTDAGQRLLVDLGTGATEFAKQLMGSEFGKGQGTLPILLTHTHLDHIQGLPFFTPFFIKGNEIRIMGADPISGLSLEATLQNQLAPHYSPLNGLENLAPPSAWEVEHLGLVMGRFRGVSDGSVRLACQAQVRGPVVVRKAGVRPRTEP